MSPIATALDQQGAELAALTARLGRRVDVAALSVLDRAGQLALNPPGLASPNGACRLFRAADGWMVANLAREEDRALIPAWLGCEFGAAPWAAIAAHAGRHTRVELVAGADLLGLPAGAVGEVVCDSLDAPLLALGAASGRRGAPKVVDLSALWAGPMCGAILAAAGATVVKVESVRRPDPTRTSTPEFFRRLNGGKRHLSLDLTAPAGQARLRDDILAADVLITSARRRAFAGLGLDPAAVFAANPGLVWVAVTGYGWTGAAASRVAFGDDAAAVGGLVGWTAAGEPRFLGDALADPVTGLAAAIGALRGLEAGGGVLVDVALARSAAGAASVCGLRRAA
ncbi:CoA transferase [Phenylobacterium sp.]|uniref:CoA transferase n=1 Tax=Phenylobacterium sp. TaxID=1871053 RepID=UPI0025EE2719|nr:CoA transferase [Phenylobacterium sp.]